jgi:hypothetical protein
MRLLWLAKDCRAAGMKVVEVPGWQARGAEFPTIPNTIVCHHTATPKAAKGDLPSQKILVEGRPDLPGPLCQLGLGRNGTVYVIASGKANHAGKGAWAGVNQSIRTVGIEAENPGDGTPWPQKQYDAYVQLVAVLVRSLGTTFEHVAGHKEWALPKGRKTDPTFDMAAFRSRVCALLLPTPKPLELPEVDDMTPEERTAFVQEIAASVRREVQKDIAVLLHGTRDGNHPANLDNLYADTQAIKKKVGA